MAFFGTWPLWAPVIRPCVSPHPWQQSTALLGEWWAPLGHWTWLSSALINADVVGHTLTQKSPLALSVALVATDVSYLSHGEALIPSTLSGGSPRRSFLSWPSTRAVVAGIPSVLSGFLPVVSHPL